MRARVVVDEKRSHQGKHTSVTTTGMDLVVELDEAKLAADVAKAGALAVADGIRSQGNKWNKTGALAGGISVQRNADGTAAVVAPADRLQRDPALLDKLADDVPAINGNSPRVDAAIEKTADEIVKVQR